MLWITLWALVVAVAQLLYGRDTNLANGVIREQSSFPANLASNMFLLALLSVVVGLLLVFRNGTAFSRWEDGRKTFGSMSSTVRSLSRYVWINVGAATYDPDRKNVDGLSVPWQSANWRQADKDEKIDALRLMCAFMVAVKRHVRNEYGTDYDDLKALLPDSFEEFVGDGYQSSGYGTIGSEYVKGAPESSDANKKKKRKTVLPEPPLSPVPPMSETSGLASNNDDSIWVTNHFKRPSLPLPLVIIHQLQLYFLKTKAKGFLDLTGPAGYNTIHQGLQALTDEMGTVERLGRMPIPVMCVLRGSVLERQLTDA